MRRNQYLGYEDQRVQSPSISKALTGIIIQLCRICKTVITLAPILLVIYLIGFIFFKERTVKIIEAIKGAFTFQ